MAGPHDRSPIDADDEVEPGLYRQLEVYVAQDLEAIGSSFLLASLLWGVAV